MDEIAKLIGTIIGYTLKFAIPAVVFLATLWVAVQIVGK